MSATFVSRSAATRTRFFGLTRLGFGRTLTSEAIYFIRTLEAERVPGEATARVQISPDGMHWCDESTVIPLPAVPGMTFARVRHFGGWLRLLGELPPGAAIKVIVYLVLKE